MKRLVIMLAAMLATFALDAQSINGTWAYTEKQKQDVNDNSVNGNTDLVMTARYTFAGDSFKLSLDAVVNMDFASDDADAPSKHAYIYIQILGTSTGMLSREGEIITLTPDPKKKPVLDIKSKVDGVPGGGMIKSMLLGPLKKEVTSALKQTEQYKIISVTDNTLTLQSIPTKKEKSKGDEHETITLTKQ